MPRPWSSHLAGRLRKDRTELLVTFVQYRAVLRQAADDAFEGGAAEHARLLDETEHDYVAIVDAGAEAFRLENELERADREATDREVDTAAVVIEQMQEIVAALAARLP